MARINYKGNIEKLHKNYENRLVQGDFIYCDAGKSGALSFWAIYSEVAGVVALDGAGNSYLPKDMELYLYETYSYWTINKRISCNNALISIEEVN